MKENQDQVSRNQENAWKTADKQTTEALDKQNKRPPFLKRALQGVLVGATALTAAAARFKPVSAESSHQEASITQITPHFGVEDVEEAAVITNQFDPFVAAMKQSALDADLNPQDINLLIVKGESERKDDGTYRNEGYQLSDTGAIAIMTDGDGNLKAAGRLEGNVLTAIRSSKDQIAWLDAQYTGDAIVVMVGGRIQELVKIKKNDIGAAIVSGIPGAEINNDKAELTIVEGRGVDPTPTATAVVVTVTPTETLVISPTLPFGTETATATPRSELDLPIAKDFKDLEALPTLTLEQFNSDAFNQQIIDRQNRGEYPDFPADVVILSSQSPITLWPDDPDFRSSVEKYGAAPLFKYKFANEDELKAWKDPKKRQYQVVERYQIPVPGENRTDYAVVIRFKNSDGTYGFWKEVYIPYLGEKNIGPDLQVRYDFGNAGVVITPAYSKDLTSCEANFKNALSQYGDVKSECEITYKGSIPVPFTDWAKTGTLNNNSGGTLSIPLSLAGGYRLPSQFNP